MIRWRVFVERSNRADLGDVRGRQVTLERASEAVALVGARQAAIEFDRGANLLVDSVVECVKLRIGDGAQKLQRHTEKTDGSTNMELNLPVCYLHRTVPKLVLGLG